MYPRMTRATTLALGLFCLATPHALAAQGATRSGPRRELVGVVKDPGGVPVEGATVSIDGTTARTDPKGFFQLWTPPVDSLTIAIHRLGFGAVEALLLARNKQWDTVMVELEPTGQKLSEVKVVGTPPQRERWMAEFEERRKNGLGVFLTREDLASRNNLKLSDILRDRRGIVLVRLGNGRYGLRFATHVGSKGASCIPDTFLDGAKAHGLEIDDILANTVEAIELYDTFSTVPMQFSHQAGSIPCGTIVIWTRLPTRPDPDATHAHE